MQAPRARKRRAEAVAGTNNSTPINSNLHHLLISSFTDIQSPRSRFHPTDKQLLSLEGPDIAASQVQHHMQTSPSERPRSSQSPNPHGSARFLEAKSGASRLSRVTQAGGTPSLCHLMTGHVHMASPPPPPSEMGRACEMKLKPKLNTGKRPLRHLTSTFLASPFSLLGYFIPRLSSFLSLKLRIPKW